MMLKQRKESTIKNIIPTIARYILTNVSESVGSNIRAETSGISSMLAVLIVKKYDNDHSCACFAEKRVLLTVSYTMNLIARNIIYSRTMAANIMRLPLSSLERVFCIYTKVIIVEYNIVFVYSVKLPVLLIPARVL